VKLGLAWDDATKGMGGSEQDFLADFVEARLRPALGTQAILLARHSDHSAI